MNYHNAAYLVHHRNGTIYSWSPILAARADMIEAVDLDEAESIAAKRRNAPQPRPQPKPPKPKPPPAEPEPTNDDPPAWDDDGNFIISNASKAELMEFAMDNYGQRLSSDATIDELRHQVAEMSGAFDIDNAAKAELVEYAETHFGARLDRRKSTKNLRKEVADLAGEVNGQAG